MALIEVDRFEGTDTERIRAALDQANRVEGPHVVLFAARAYQMEAPIPFAAVTQLRDVTIDGRGSSGVVFA